MSVLCKDKVDCHINSEKMAKSRSFIIRLFKTKFRSVKLKCFLLVAFVISVYFIIAYKLIEIAKTNKHVENKLELKRVILHFDLKGSPPKITYLKTLLPKLQSLGVTGLLIEYEDMFPYQGQLFNLSATNHYDIKELQEFIKLAVDVGFDVIPLVQTFGHMEHALKLHEFQHLREIPLYPDSICPSQSQSIELIKNMLDQIIKFHQNIFPLKYLHIGADEVYHINKCEQCLRRRQSQLDIFLSHVNTVLEIVKTANPYTTVLIWDDMFRSIPMDKWKDITLSSNMVEPVYWEYAPTFKISHSSLMEYHKKFKHIWIAAAFKGADGRMATFPDLRTRFWNHLTWLQSIADYKFGGESVAFDFSGIILTGWSRYSHMDPPCELLPVSIPSLYLNLLLLKKFKYFDLHFEDDDANDVYSKHLHEDFTDNLHCSETINIEYFDATNCYYGGSELFITLKDCNIIITDIINRIGNLETELSTFEFNSNIYNNFNMNRLRENLIWCNQSITNLENIKKKLINNLSYYYDSSFVNEYVNYKLFRPMKIVNKLLNILQNKYKVQSWLRRT